MFSVPSKNALLRVLVPRSRLRLALAAAATAALFVWAPFWSAVWLGPVVWIVAAVLVPFASPWSAFDYAVPLEHWNDMYQGKFRTAGVTAKSGPRGPTPPVYANGWYKIAESEEVPPLGIKNVRFMGSDLVLFRGPSGQLGLVDAYCPHLGAHLGVGGTVTPECPFHGWRFAADGRCVEIPYSSGSIPAQASTRAHRVMETHRSVLTWFDAEGREPQWLLQDAWPQILAGYVRVGRATHHIACHGSEVPENGADVAHLNHLHTDVHPWLRWLKRFVDARFVWTATWQPSTELPHCSDMTLTERFVVAGREVALVGSDAVIRQVGPGLVVLSLQTAFGSTVLLQSLTPEEPYLQRLETVAYCSPGWLNLTAANRLLLLAYAENVERDVLIWSRKQYRAAPVLVRHDGPIARFRKWYGQFYSPSSPTWHSLCSDKSALLDAADW